MSSRTSSNAVDGRRLRSERSKQAIMDACEQLMQEGQLVPTAQMISDKAGVPIRTFFRHYPDMETLFSAADELLKPKYTQVFEQPPGEGSLSQRIANAVELHAESFEQNYALLKSTKAQLWRYQLLRKNYAGVNRGLRKDLDMRIPELKAIDAEARELVDGLTSAEMWLRLRDDQQLSRAKSVELIKRAVALIVKTSVSANSQSNT